MEETTLQMILILYNQDRKSLVLYVAATRKDKCIVLSKFLTINDFLLAISARKPSWLFTIV